MATDRDDWLDETKKFAEQCSWVIIALDGAPVTCSLQAFTLGLVAKTADAKMSTAVNELGKPPGEIESLVADLRTSAAAMDQAGEAIPDKCPEAGDRCADSWIAFERAVDDFQSALNAWAPYV